MRSFQKISDWAAKAFGSVWFIIFHFIWWGTWVGFRVEPFPYGLLTLIVSLEAIILAGLLLNATNRVGEEDRTVIRKDLNLDGKSYALLEQIWDKLKDTP